MGALVCIEQDFFYWPFLGLSLSLSTLGLLWRTSRFSFPVEMGEFPVTGSHG